MSWANLSFAEQFYCVRITNNIFVKLNLLAKDWRLRTANNLLDMSMVTPAFRQTNTLKTFCFFNLISTISRIVNEVLEATRKQNDTLLVLISWLIASNFLFDSINHEIAVLRIAIFFSNNNNLFIQNIHFVQTSSRIGLLIIRFLSPDYYYYSV